MHTCVSLLTLSYCLCSWFKRYKRRFKILNVYFNLIGNPRKKTLLSAWGSMRPQFKITYQPTDPPTRWPTNPSTRQPTHPPTRPPTRPPANPSARLTRPPPAKPPANPPAQPSIRPIARPPVHQRTLRVIWFKWIMYILIYIAKNDRKKLHYYHSGVSRNPHNMSMVYI